MPKTLVTFHVESDEYHILSDGKLVRFNDPKKKGRTQDIDHAPQSVLAEAYSQLVNRLREVMDSWIDPRNLSLEIYGCYPVPPRQRIKGIIDDRHIRSMSVAANIAVSALAKAKLIPSIKSLSKRTIGGM
ncbi:hypothetical protein KKH27_02280 [bacterium]|nr:hypothetical protein [bacterium]MBU1983971.1 hypothetical protein [bacterium]